MYKPFKGEWIELGSCLGILDKYEIDIVGHSTFIPKFSGWSYNNIQRYNLDECYRQIQKGTWFSFYREIK